MPKLIAISLMFAGLTSAAHGQTLPNVLTERCAMFTVFLQFPEVMTPELRLFLEGIHAGIEATGMPRGSFGMDFQAECRENPNLDATEIINRTFDRYRDLLGSN